MSRWHEKMKQHRSYNELRQIVKICDDLKADNQAAQSQVEEVARCNKVVAYINGLVESADPELIPDSTWSNFDNQTPYILRELTNYQANRNISHVTQANAHLDNLVAYIVPFVKDGRSAAAASTRGFNKYHDTIKTTFDDYKTGVNAHLDRFKQQSSKLLAEYAQRFEALGEKLDQSTKISEQLDTLRVRYFTGTDDEASLEESIEELYNELAQYQQDFNKYHQQLLGDEGASIKARIEQSQRSFESRYKRINALFEHTSEKIDELDAFHNKVFGGNDNAETGLKHEIELRISELDTHQQEQKAVHEGLTKSAKELLDWANNAGLASSYQKLKRSFNWQIHLYTIGFVVCITALVGLSFWSYAVTQTAIEISLSAAGSAPPEGEAVIAKPAVLDYLMGFLKTGPLALPLIWLAVFTSKRRSEAQRLQQEYAHKEAITMSFENFKRQVRDISDEQDDELMKKLMGVAIDAISQNASETLDKKHGDQMPSLDAIEKLAKSCTKITRAIAPLNSGANKP